MSSTTDGEARFVRDLDLHVVDMDGELVMMGLEQGEYYGMREVAAKIWQLLETPHTVAELCSTIVSEYDVEPDRCHRDVSDFLQTLRDKKLVSPAVGS